MITIHKSYFGRVVSCLLLTACADAKVQAPSVPPSKDILFNVIARPKGITLAVGDTVQLTAQAFNLLGDSLPIPSDTLGDDAIVFRSSDPTRLRVNRSGQAEAVLPTSGTSMIAVYVSWQHLGITRADTIRIRVNAARPAKLPTSISIQPRVGDSTKLGLDAVKTMPFAAYASDGTIVSDVIAHFTIPPTSDKSPVATIVPSTGSLTMRRTGSVWIYAESMAYGVLLRDSVRWVGIERVTAQNVINFVAGQSEEAFTYFLSPCGSLSISNATHGVGNEPIPILVEMERPDRAGICKDGDVPGDFGEIQPGAAAVRVFPEAGEVHMVVYDARPPRRRLRTITLQVR